MISTPTSEEVNHMKLENLLFVRQCLMPDFQHSVSVAVRRCRSRSRFRKTCPYKPLMPLLLGPVRSNSAAGPGRRAQGAGKGRRVSRAKEWAELQARSLEYERQIRKNRTRSYMNG